MTRPISKHRANIDAVTKNGDEYRYVMRRAGGREYIYDQREKAFVSLGEVPKINVDTRLSEDG